MDVCTDAAATKILAKKIGEVVDVVVDDEMRSLSLWMDKAKGWKSNNRPSLSTFTLSIKFAITAKQRLRVVHCDHSNPSH